MTKFLLTTAGVAAVLTLLSGGRRQRPFPNDGAYLRALADVHDYCPDDFMRLCTSQGTEMEEEPADEGLVAPVRRLATLLIDVRAVDADSDAEAHGPSRHAAPLRLGRYRDMCLRAHYDELSTECKAAVALVDDAAEAMPHHHGMCPVMLSLFLGALVGIVFLGRKIRAKKQIMKKILEAIRADTQLQALVEAKAGVSVPEPCQCKCVLLRAVASALLLSMFVGAPAVMVFSLIGCCCCKCWKCCRGGCCGPKPEEAPEDYAALSDAEKQPSSLLAASQKS